MINKKNNQSGKFSLQTWLLGAVILCVFILTLSLMLKKNNHESAEGIKNNFFGVDSPAIYSQPLVVSTLNYVLRIAPVNANSVRATQEGGNTIRYQEAYQNTDVEQIKYANKLKESLILKSANHPEKFEYQIDTQNFDWVFDGEGNIIISSKKEVAESVPSSDGGELPAERMRQYIQEQKKIFKIPKPYMYEFSMGSATPDLRDETSLGKVKTEIIGDRLILTPDKQWIRNHQYPIVVDPTVEKMPRMVRELAEKRSYNSLTFLNDDGSYTTMAHVGHINYQDKNDEFQLVDTTLQKTDNGWEQDKASYKSVFPKYADEWLEFENMYEQGGTLFKMKPVANHVAGQLVTDKNDEWRNKKVVYIDAFGKGNDLELIAGNVALFKYIKLNQKPVDLSQDLEFNFELGLKEGEKLIINGKEWNGVDEVITLEAIGITAPDGQISYLRRFSVWDNKKLQAIKIKIVKQSGKIYFTKILPKEFLASAEYPVYTDASASYYSGAGDGWVSHNAANWNDAHNALSGSTTNYIGTYTLGPETYYDSTPVYYITRAFIPVDSSGLPDNAEVSLASLYLYRYQVKYDDNDAYAYLNIVQTTQASNTTLGNGDYDTCGSTHSPTTGSTNKNLNGTSAGYNQFAFNSTGLTWVSLTSYTKLGLREGHDLADMAIEGDGYQNTWRFYTSEQTGTDNDPYLSVTYNVAPTTSNVIDTPDPTNPGRSVSFIVDWDDSAGDSVKIKVCKTDSLTSQNCDGGYWASSTDFTTADPATVVYDVVAEDAGQTRDYWAFVCDNDGECTTGSAGTFSVNAQSTVPNIKVRGGTIRGGTKAR